jgi:methylmalonyl-CoA mutase C-terminal domain/subunit
VVGGIIPERDVPKLKEVGVAGVLTPGATADQVVAMMREVIGASQH